MPSAADPSKCTGCGTCSEKCPEEAITMNAEGQPVVDQSKCTECGVCVISCPYQARDIKDVLTMIT